MQIFEKYLYISSMIVEFSLANYRSFNELQTLSFQGTQLTSEDNIVDANNLFADTSLLKILGIYGPNASGKSNLIKGLTFFKEMVDFSQETESFLLAEISPFRLSAVKAENFGYFQIVLLLEGKLYRYGFTLSENAVVQNEWLYGPAEKNETYYFKRSGQNLTFNDRFKQAKSLPYKTSLRPNTLFLTFCSSYDVPVPSIIKDFITNKIRIDGYVPRFRIKTVGDERIKTDDLVKNDKKDIVLAWLREAGLNYTNVELRNVDFGRQAVGNLVLLTKLVHNEYDDVIGSVLMTLDEEESQGTRKYYAFIGELTDKFTNGGIFIADEIDSNFHPALLRKIIQLFQNPKINIAGAQLLFTSHDTNLLKPDIMRRDQFYFTEKTLKDETILYSLAALRGVRNNADFARQYLAGFYGAMPQLQNYLEENQILATSHA